MKPRNPLRFLLLSALAALAPPAALAAVPAGATLKGPPGVVQPLAPIFTCYLWVMAYEDQTCPEIAVLFKITLEQFMDWNPQLRNDCAKNFWGGYHYCVIQDDAPKDDSIHRGSRPLMVSPS